MTTDQMGRFDEHATVSFQKGTTGKGQPRRAGIRVGFGSAYCWIPNDEILTLARELVNYIDTQETR